MNISNLIISNKFKESKHIKKTKKNKHSLHKLTKQNSINQYKIYKLISNFYSFSNAININLIKYNDLDTKLLLHNALNKFQLCSSYTIDLVITYFEDLNKAFNEKHKLLKSMDLTVKTEPKLIKLAFEDFSHGLKSFIVKQKHIHLPHKTINNAFVKLWECLTIFDLIPTNTNKLRVLHICEAPGQMILACKYFVEQKCKNIKNYDWRANSLNPFNDKLKHEFGKFKIFGDDYGLLQKNPTKWLWGDDDTGDITSVKNIKWFRNYLYHSKDMLEKNTFLNNDKLNLIIGDGGLSTDMEPLLLQKLDLAQVIMVMACSSIGGSSVIKHFTPYITHHINTYNAIGFFIGFLYMYFIAFEEISLFKPYTSNPDSGEFYVIGKHFIGINDDQLTKLYTLLDNFELNNAIIPLDMIPETFIMQINIFLEKMTKLNIMALEKEQLLLTCYKNHNKPKYLKCNAFMNETSLQNILEPRYNAWIKKYKFT